MTTSNTANWAEILRAVALEVLGQPAERRGDEWRYGRRGSLVVNVGGNRAGSWYDFEAGLGGGALEFLRHHEGLDKPQALDWLRTRGLLPDSPPIRPASRQTSSTRRGGPRVGETAGKGRPGPRDGPLRPDPETQKRLEWARSLWQRSQPIPMSPDHPARRWLADRKLWRPDLPLPAAIRWAPAAGRHTGAGSIVALAARPEAWASAWPELPGSEAVQLVHVNAQGKSALDRPAEDGGLGKRTIGLVQGAVVILGNPCLPDVSEPVHVAEGLADALALASRHEGTAVAALGTSGMMDGPLATWLAAAPRGVQVHCDTDEPKLGRPPAGRRAAAILMLAIRNAKGQAAIVTPGAGFKDAADKAAAGPDFGPLPEGWENYARTLRETTEWPRWEIARVAAIFYEGVDDDE